MKITNLLRIIFCGLAMAIFTNVQAQKVAVKTDMLLLGLMSPNVGGELIVGERSSIGLSLFTMQKPYGKDIKIKGMMPEYRYWFNGRPLIREFVGLTTLAANYDITWKDDIYKGDALGAGLSFGYAWRIGRRFAIEAYASCSLVYFNHKHYNVNDNFEDYEAFEDNHNKLSGVTVVPSKIGISFTYIIK